MLNIEVPDKGTAAQESDAVWRAAMNPLGTGCCRSWLPGADGQGLSGEPESLLPEAAAPRRPRPRGERGVINPSNNETHEATHRLGQRLPQPSRMPRSRAAGAALPRSSW